MTARETARAALAAADEETRERLLDAEARVAAAQAELERARMVRDTLVLDALDEGWTQQRVAETLGLSFQRIYQIRRGGR